MFTPVSNFTYGNYRIANINLDTIDENVELQIHIQKYEAEAFRVSIGQEMYAELLTKLDTGVNGFTVKATAEQKWKDLVNGVTYVNTNTSCNGCPSGINVRWRGFVNEVAVIGTGVVRESIFASYIFYKWALNHRTLNFGTGNGTLKSNAVKSEPYKTKIVDSWNEFVKYIDFGESCTMVSLNQYLQAHKADFPTMQLMDFNTMTYYDI